MCQDQSKIEKGTSKFFEWANKHIENINQIENTQYDLIFRCLNPLKIFPTGTYFFDDPNKY
jgi:hypothetical protein